MGAGSTTNLGNRGEGLAVDFLKEKGYTILLRNYRYRKAEIDIIALGEGYLVILEVKTRSGAFYEQLSESIPRGKIKRIVAAANHFIQERSLFMEVRFDIIQVILTPGNPEIHHLKDAFYFF